MCRLESTGRGGSLNKDGTVRCSALAFADDLLVLNDKDDVIPIDLDIIDKFLTNTGMCINIGKSALISGALVPGEGRIVPRTKPFINHKGQPIK